MTDLTDLERRVRSIEERNLRVERDKSWETSLTRTLLIMGLTYVVTTIVYFSLSFQAPLQNALIPTIAFGLSVQTLPIVKRWWLRSRSQS